MLRFQAMQEISINAIPFCCSHAFALRVWHEIRFKSETLSVCQSFMVPPVMSEHLIVFVKAQEIHREVTFLLS